MSAPAIDEALLRFARTHGHNQTAERVIGAYSRTGEHAACWFALGGLGAALAPTAEQRRQWLCGAATVGIAYAANYVVKLAVRRRRPVLKGLPPLTPTVSRLSFPSAHATSSFAAACAYRDLAPAKALYAAAAAFALSRPYLGVHYPSDVVAGALLGTGIAEARARRACR